MRLEISLYSRRIQNRTVDELEKKNPQVMDNSWSMAWPKQGYTISTIYAQDSN